MGAWTAAEIYGTTPSPQPTPTPTPDHAPGAPEPTGRTEPRATGPAANPVLVLVVLVGVAVVLVQLVTR